MSNPSEKENSLISFLGLDQDDFLYLGQFEAFFAQDVEKMASVFYQYLFSHTATAATFRDYSEIQIESLIKKQAEHGIALLRSELNPQWQSKMKQLGARHHALAIDPTWMAGAYAIYWRHWQEIVEKRVRREDQTRLRQILFSLLMGDLMSQLRGYVSAARETENERTAVFDSLLDALATSQGKMENAGILEILCTTLTHKSRYITLAGYFLMPGVDSKFLKLEAASGLKLSIQMLPLSEGDPFWEAFHHNQIIIQATDDPDAPQWIQRLRPRVQELALTPFGTGELRGVGFVGARAKGYFNRVGLRYFDAFTHLGEIVLRLRNQLLRDPLTQIPNRLLFLDRLEIARRQAVREDTLLGLAMLDLDGLKPINDRFGHIAGDRILITITQRIRNCLRSGDSLGRMSSDEFGLLFPALNSIDDLDLICARILESIRQPIELDGELVKVTASLGITLYPLDDAPVEPLMAHADLALYSAKNQGGDQQVLFSVKLDDFTQKAASMRHILAQALKKGYLEMYYQPIVNGFGHVSGVESLIRIRDPERGLLCPASFWAGLDHHRYARDVGLFVMDASFRQGAIWYAQGLNLRISINISAHHLLDVRFLDDLERAIKKYPGLPVDHIEIEITESAPLLDLGQARERLEACNHLGVRIALDDFGTGNASLTYLQQLPAQSVKLDQSFVRDMIHDPKDLAIVAAVITASRMLGLDVIAEGVETEAHAKLLAKMGCGHLQGYLFAKPMPGSEIPLWLQQFCGIDFMIGNRSSIDIFPAVLEGHAQLTEFFLHALRKQKTITEHVLEFGAEGKCHLGRWLKGEGVRRLGEKPGFSLVQQGHKKIHQLARQAKLALDEGDLPSALHLGSDLEAENKQMIEHLRELIRDAESAVLMQSCYG